MIHLQLIRDGLYDVEIEYHGTKFSIGSFVRGMAEKPEAWVFDTGDQVFLDHEELTHIVDAVERLNDGETLPDGLYIRKWNIW